MVTNPLLTAGSTLGFVDSIMDWFTPPGSDPVATGALLATQPKVAAPYLAALGLDPDTMGNSMMNPADPVWSGLPTASPPLTPGSAEPGPLGGSGLLGALSGIKAPTAPEAHIPRIGAPGAYNPPGSIGIPNIANMMAQLSGKAQAPIDMLRLRPAILGGR